MTKPILWEEWLLGLQLFPKDQYIHPFLIDGSITLNFRDPHFHAFLFPFFTLSYRQMVCFCTWNFLPSTGKKTEDAHLKITLQNNQNYCFQGRLGLQPGCCSADHDDVQLHHERHGRGGGRISVREVRQSVQARRRGHSGISGKC